MADKDSRKAEAAAEDGVDIGPPLISMQKDSQETKVERRPSVTPSMKIMQKKKSIVMTEAAVKDLQKQLRANKEERRIAMDGRYTYIFSLLSDALGLDMSTIEDHILSDEKFGLIDEFFTKNGSRKLIFFHQELSKDGPNSGQKKLFITTGQAEGLNGICCFFLRTSNLTEVTTTNISSEVSFMWMDCSQGKILEGFESVLSKVLAPVLRSQKSWGTELDENTELITDFLESLDKFTGSLAGVNGNMTGQVVLKETEHDVTLKELRTLSDYKATANSCEMVEALEATLACWLKQIEQVLTESEQIRREADNVGPSAELVYWRCRMTTFNSLLEQIKSPRCRSVIGVLNAGRSKSIPKWNALDARVTDAANEAKDNVKYLYTLDSLFGPLAKCNPSSIIELIPSIINAVRMIYSISTYYNTSEQMTSLFVKVTNQMITMSKAYLNQGVQRVWDHPRDELLRRIKDCMALNEAYQRQFHKTKEKLSETPSEKQFQFSENYIFGKFDTFTRRLQKISDMVAVMDTYAGLTEIRVDGIEVLAIRYKNIVDAAKKKKVPTATLR